MAEPLTPAQVELIQKFLEDRQERLRTELDTQIADAVRPLQAQVDALSSQVATLQEAVAVLDAAAAKIGDTVGLRLASGKVLCARDGGPTRDGEPVVLEARTTVGAWESFLVERGL